MLYYSTNLKEKALLKRFDACKDISYWGNTLQFDYS